MASSSTLPAVKARLVSLLTDALATSSASGGQVPVFYAWNPDATDECVFLGRALLDPADRDEIEIVYEYPTVETNRPCFERYDVPISVWSFRGDLSPDQADDAETRIGVLLDVVLDVLEDVDLGIGAHVSCRPGRVVWRRIPYTLGWACFAVVEPTITATLT
jgi:hypothetical protein